jgi:signal transduction histidine kinase
MQSRSRFAKRSSISAGSRSLAPAFVVATVLGAVAGALGLALDRAALTGVGLVVGLSFAGAFAATLIVQERRRHVVAEDELQAQASFLESLVDSIAAVSTSHEPGEILERTADEARRLFDADEVRLTQEGEEADTPADTPAPRVMRVRLAIRGEPIAVLVLRRREPFRRWDVVRASMLADFASHAVENARLVLEAQEREADRLRLTDRLINAEQDERRRLSIWLHDGPLSTMSGVALMHDAALAAIEDGRYEDAAKVVTTALARERDTIRTLRDLSFALEPLVLRDQGFEAAVQAVGEQIEASQRIRVLVDVRDGERLAEKAQVELYQIIRESLDQAVQRKPKEIKVTVGAVEGGGYRLEVADDGVAERRRGSIEDIEERVRVLNARLSVDQGGDGGTRIVVDLPAYVAAATG